VPKYYCIAALSLLTSVLQIPKQRDKYPAASVRPGNSIKLCGDLFNI